MSFRISRSSGIEPSRRRSLSQQRPDTSSYSDYRAPSSSVVSTSRRPYPGSSASGTSASSYYSPSLSASSSAYLRNGGQRSSPYISKYSNYENGVTTAGLNLGGASSSSWYPGGSNQSLNTLTTPSTSSLYRSHSLREQERKSRSRNRTAVANKIMAASSTAKRSQSCSSEKSEGYESGGEESRKSRLTDGQSATTTTTTTSNNGEFIDYKALYEATKAENDKLRVQLHDKDEQLSTSKAALERITNATTKNSLSELEKRERRAMERKMSEMEEELKQLDVLKTENQRLKDENGALIRVISKLSK